MKPGHLRTFQDKSTEWVDEIHSADVVLVFGGDGTLHRHLSCIADARLPVLVIPTGSGNDFASSIGIDSQRQALRLWADFRNGSQNVAAIDLGVIRSSETNQRHYFCCSAYLGLDSATNAVANRLPRFIRAHGGYILSLFPAVVRFRAQRVTLSDVDGNTLQSDPAMLTCLANTPRYGHGLRIAPAASLNDGLLDVCFVRKIPKLTLLALFSIVYWGKHTRLPFVSMNRGARFTLATSAPTPLFADGEYVCDTPAEVSLLPRALRFIVPEGSPLLRGNC